MQSICCSKWQMSMSYKAWAAKWLLLHRTPLNFCLPLSLWWTGTTNFLRGNPRRVGKQGFGGNPMGTLRFLTEQVVPTLKRQFNLPEDVKIIPGGYSLVGLFALWVSTQTNLFYGIAAASPSVWFPRWMEFEQQHPVQTQHVYLNLGDREERTKIQWWPLWTITFALCTANL